MLVYLGVETFLEVVDASRELKRATDSATTPKELEDAAQRSAHRVGPRVARVLVLAATVVVSQGLVGGPPVWLRGCRCCPTFHSRPDMRARFPDGF
jgi:hypothetical protein